MGTHVIYLDCLGTKEKAKASSHNLTKSVPGHLVKIVPGRHKGNFGRGENCSFHFIGCAFVGRLVYVSAFEEAATSRYTVHRDIK